MGALFAQYVSPAIPFSSSLKRKADRQVPRIHICFIITASGHKSRSQGILGNFRIASTGRISVGSDKRLLDAARMGDGRQ
jgi:hypothetical protein